MRTPALLLIVLLSAGACSPTSSVSPPASSSPVRLSTSQLLKERKSYLGKRVQIFGVFGTSVHPAESNILYVYVGDPCIECLCDPKDAGDFASAGGEVTVEGVVTQHADPTAIMLRRARRVFP